MTTSKIEDKYENPIDVLAYKLCTYIEPLFAMIKATPNNITTISLLCGLLCVYYMNINKYYAFTFYWLSYIFDCLDGYYARKHNMLSKLGDMYDHYSDLFKHVLIYHMLYKKLDKKKFIQFNTFLASIGIGLFIQMGCQEKKYEEKIGEEEAKRKSGYLGSFKPLCSNPEIVARYSRFFGVGTVTLLFSIYILLI